MKALFIGGTGTISSAISELASEKGWELYLLNRGNRKQLVPDGVKELVCDIGNEAEAEKLLSGMDFDVVADFIVYTPEQLERDIRLFSGKTRQYMFISTAMVYRKPPTDIFVKESCIQDNPYSVEYAQNKIKCEDILSKAGRDNKFPYTIVRPSHTYSKMGIPVSIHGKNGSWQVLDRMLKGKPVIVQGDGTTLWTTTHNTDFAKAFVALMGNPHAVQECFHITSDEALTWNKIYETIGDALGVTPKLVHIPTDFLVACDDEDFGLTGSLTGDKSNVALFDNSKVKAVAPEFVCTTRFDQGVRIALDFMEKNPEFKRADPVFDDWCDRVIEAYETGLKAYKRK